MSEEKMREKFEAVYAVPSFIGFDGNKYSPVPLAVNEENMEIASVFNIRWEAWQAALQESEAGAVSTYVMTDHLVAMREYGSAFAHLRSCLGQQVRPNSEYTALYAAPPSAQAIETAAYMRAAEVCDRHIAHWGDRFPGETQAVIFVKDALLALIIQDGRTALEKMMLEAYAAGVKDALKDKEEFGMAVAQEVAVALVGLSASYQADKLRAIVTNLIGVPPLSSESVSGEGK